VLEKLPQVVPPLDPEVAVPLTDHLIAKGVELHLGDGLARIDAAVDGRSLVVAESGAVFPADLVISSGRSTTSESTTGVETAGTQSSIVGDRSE
jgi:NADPH-dependent 2,4-dienoyl-CoA reductase/sulfur reductase-like enzyme